MKKQKLLSLLLMALFVCTSSILSSCGSSDDPVPPPPPPANSITVNGVESTNISFTGDFNGKGGDNFKQYVTVVSNTPWSITGAPDWLSISPSNGNGTVQIELYPKSENNTATPRTATVTLTAGDATATINISQEAGKPVCVVSISNEVALYNGFCWEYTNGGKVNTFQLLVLSENEHNRMTDREITEEISKDEPKKFDDGYIYATGIDSYGNRIQPNTVYYVVTLATDENGKAGELTRKKIKTPVFLNNTEDAWAVINDANISGMTFQFSIMKKGYCRTYHLIYGTTDEGLPRSLYAFQINYFIKHQKLHWMAESREWEIKLNYPNDDVFTYNSINMILEPWCFAYAWGVFEDGSISSDIVGSHFNTSVASAAQNAQAQPKDSPEPFIIKRSEIEKQK